MGPNVRAGLINSRISSKKSSLFCSLFLWGVSSLCSGSSPVSLVDSLKGAQSAGFEYVHYDRSGKVLWELSGKSSVFKSENLVTVSSPCLKVPFQGGVSELTAGEARVSIRDQICWLSSNVRVDHADGMELNAGELRYGMTGNGFDFSKGFRLKKDFFQVQGQKGHYDLKTEALQVDGRTTLEVNR